MVRMPFGGEEEDDGVRCLLLFLFVLLPTFWIRLAVLLLIMEASKIILSNCMSVIIRCGGNDDVVEDVPFRIHIVTK